MYKPAWEEYADYEKHDDTYDGIVIPYECKDTTEKQMLKIRADVHKEGKNGCIHFSEYSKNVFEKEVDAWNYLDKFKKSTEDFYDMKGYVKCYVCKYENGKEILMCRA